MKEPNHIFSISLTTLKAWYGLACDGFRLQLWYTIFFSFKMNFGMQMKKWSVVCWFLEKVTGRCPKVSLKWLDVLSNSNRENNDDGNVPCKARHYITCRHNMIIKTKEEYTISGLLHYFITFLANDESNRVEKRPVAFLTNQV